jgi:hypothetical protein
MGLVITIDVVVITVLIVMASRRGLEEALPFVAFIFVLIPRDAAIQIPGLFDLTTQRLVLLTMIVLYLFLPHKKLDLGGFYTPVKWLIIIHIVWCLLSTANSIVSVMSLKKMVSVVLEYYMLFYLFSREIRHVRTVKRILLGIVSAVIVCSVFGAIEAYQGLSVMEWFPQVVHRFDNWSTAGELSGRGIRVASTFAHPILFGAGLTIAIVLTLYLLKVVRGTGKRIFLWTGLLLMFLNIYKTSSRGPWLGVTLSLGILLLWDKGRGRRYLTLIGILALAVLTIRPGVWDTIANMYRESFNPESPLGSSYEYRYVLRELAVDAVSRNVTRSLWGYGMESFYYLGLEGNLNGKPYRFLSCDSAWIELLIETGYVGLLIIAVVLLSPVWYAWKGLRHVSSGNDGVQLYLISAMVGYYFMMLSAAMYSWGQTGYMLWMMIAVSLAYSRLRNSEAIASRIKLLKVDNEAELIPSPPSVNYGG